MVSGSTVWPDVALSQSANCDLASRFALRTGVAKAPVVGQRLQLAQLVEVGDPAVADGLGDRAGQRRVRQQQPAPRRDAVGLVVETLGKHLGQILDRLRAQQLGVDRGHAVGAVRADDGQIGHADLPLGALFDQAHALRRGLRRREIGLEPRRAGGG